MKVKHFLSAVWAKYKKQQKLISHLQFEFAFLVFAGISLFYVFVFTQKGEGTAKIVAMQLLYDVCIGAFTAGFVYLLIDYVQEKNRRIEDEKKKKQIYGKIVKPLDTFYRLFVDIYAGTLENKIEDNDPVLQNIFTDKTTLYQSIVDYLDYAGDSPYIDADRTDARMTFAQNSRYCPPHTKWSATWDTHYKNLLIELYTFDSNFGVFLNSETLAAIARLIEVLANVQSNKDFYKKMKFDQMTVLNRTKETDYSPLQLPYIMTLFEKVMIAIGNEIGQNILAVSIEKINNRNNHPLLGELRKTT